MAEGFEAYHVPQQSRRDKLRILSHSHHNPSDLFGFPSSNSLVKEEPPSNLIRFVGDSRHCHDPQQLYPPSDPQPSSSANPNPLQEDNTAFLCTRHDLGNVGRLGHPSYGSVDFAVGGCDGNIIGNNNARGLSLSLWSRVNSQGNDDRRNLPPPLELNLEGYGSALEYDGRGGRCFGEVLIGPLGPFTGYSSVLRGSRFLKPAQQLLEELCHAGREVFALERASESDSSQMEVGGEGIGDADYQCGVGNEFGGKKSRLKSMLDEVCKRYKQYYQQLQNVVASFECVAGLGNAAPYVNLALTVMSKHFRCLKDAIMDQFQFTMKAHEKLRNTRVDVPRFETDERPLLGKRGIQNSGCLEHQPVWRPQRGLPERAVTVLRAWLFEHFLHPYPSDNDKLMLAKETGLSRSQVSNWFINARVRLWKPMVEEIHMLETQQTQKATQTSNDQFSLSSSVPSTSAPRIHDTLAMRTAGELAADGSTVRNEQTHHLSYSEYQPSSLPHVVSESVRSVKTSSVTLTLGLHHQNNIGMPVGAAQRVGLGREKNGEGYVMGGDYGMQEVQLLRDFGG